MHAGTEVTLQGVITGDVDGDAGEYGDCPLLHREILRLQNRVPYWRANFAPELISLEGSFNAMVKEPTYAMLANDA